MQENKPLLIVGLGNPGGEYERTRHNVGFMAICHLAGDDAVWKNEHFAKTFRTQINGHRIIFAMPQTFMNDSGRSVAALMTFYKIPLENLTVIHDDMDLPVGSMRSKIGGGSAGHNGIKSIDAAVGREYRRIRLGIDHPRNSGLMMSPADWVLGRFTNDQMDQIQDTIHKIKLFD